MAVAQGCCCQTTQTSGFSPHFFAACRPAAQPNRLSCMNYRAQPHNDEAATQTQLFFCQLLQRAIVGRVPFLSLPEQRDKTTFQSLSIYHGTSAERRTFGFVCEICFIYDSTVIGSFVQDRFGKRPPLRNGRPMSPASGKPSLQIAGVHWFLWPFLFLDPSMERAHLEQRILLCAMTGLMFH